ncbi:hypothetical protein KKF91_15595 [Myxococcota bacterium]|nr:hypothetical protein [Myxococcota bacterium]
MLSVLVTITVEADRQRGRIQAHTSTHNLKALWALHAMMKAIAAPPTYLITYPITQRQDSAPLLEYQAAGECELGACFQPWMTPPFDDVNAFASQEGPLPGRVISDKIVHLTDAVSGWMGARPRSFRTCSARLTGQILQTIERLGYRIDSSVTPLYHEAGAGGDDRHAPQLPYFPDRQAPIERGSSPILEIPLTVGWPRPIPELLLKAQRRLPRRLSARLPKMIWLDPTRHTLDEMKALAHVNAARGLPVLNVSMTSSELWRNQAVALRTLEGFLGFARGALGAQPRTMQQLCCHYINQALGE